MKRKIQVILLFWTKRKRNKNREKNQRIPFYSLGSY